MASTDFVTEGQISALTAKLNTSLGAREPKTAKLTVTWDHAALVWRDPAGAQITSSTHPDWASFQVIVYDASSALNANELDLSVLPSGATPTVTMSAAQNAGLVTVQGGSGGTTMSTMTYDQLSVV